MHYLVKRGFWAEETNGFVKAGDPFVPANKMREDTLRTSGLIEIDRNSAFRPAPSRKVSTPGAPIGRAGDRRAPEDKDAARKTLSLKRK
jgi:hypothetical protein